MKIYKNRKEKKLYKPHANLDVTLGPSDKTKREKFTHTSQNET